MKAFATIMLVANLATLASGFVAPRSSLLSARTSAPRGARASVHMNSLLDFVDGTGESYGPIGSLYRQGPVPLFIRLFQPEKYEMSVTQYMAKEDVDRNQAQGNMDAYFADPNGWALEKMSGKDRDYYKIGTDPQQMILTTVWGGGITSLLLWIFLVRIPARMAAQHM
eukprot:CAMPEP_0119506598 /NCGR_PEP_ID=MMETSP1344-20130328/26768_1 /TAXON_ID=236787 /ORGANISM="Florenciella parvula, Strain CCMP2471" /LENGTH=167 /DNA_ID=CAMNT_0007543155 /DNA_START=29 /DNA_END=532 /DNA_ORIENTATION=+